MTEAERRQAQLREAASKTALCAIDQTTNSRDAVAAAGVAFATCWLTAAMPNATEANFMSFAQACYKAAHRSHTLLRS